MKIKISELDTIIKLLKKLPYFPTNEKAKIFFEIDCDKTVEEDGFVMEVKDQNKGALALTKPGLVLGLEDGKTVVDLAYAIMDYTPKFNIETYFDILNVKIPAKCKELLEKFDAYLVRNDAILIQFEI